MSSQRAQWSTIAHILPWPNIGGTEIATLRVAKAIDQSRFKSIAYCLPEAETKLRTLFLDQGYPVASYHAIEPSLRHPGKFLQTSFALAREFRNRKVDLVHCADVKAAYHAGLAGRLARLPVLCHVRNRFDSLTSKERRYLASVHQFAFVSQDTWKHFAHPVPAGKGTVIYDGIEIPPEGQAERASVRQEFHIPENTPVIGMLARVAPQKDYPTLAKAAVRVLAEVPNTRFLIVGDNELTEVHRAHYQEVLKTLKECGVADAFIFTGQRGDARRILNGIDIFALSTNWEGLPLVILEAMAQGKPVVATAVDGIPEVVKDGDTGLLYPHGDSEQLAAQLLVLLRNPSRAVQMGERGRSFVQERFTTEQFGQSMNNLYSSLLGA